MILEILSNKGILFYTNHKIHFLFLLISVVMHIFKDFLGIL